MNYEELLIALNSNEEGQRNWLKRGVIDPCINGHSNAVIEYFIDEELAEYSDFVKPELFSIYSFAFVRLSEVAYELYVRAHYVDTLALQNGDFAKVNVGVAIDGTVNPQASEFEGGVYTSITERLK